MASDMGALRDQTVLNIREWGGRRKQRSVLNKKTATSELELSPYGGQLRTRDLSDSGVLLFVFDGRRLAEG